VAPFDWLTTKKNNWTLVGKLRVLKASCKLKDKEVFPKNEGSDIFWNKIQGTFR